MRALHTVWHRIFCSAREPEEGAILDRTLLSLHKVGHKILTLAGARSHENLRAVAGAVLRGLQELGGRLVPAEAYQQLARAAQLAVRGGGGGASVMLNVLDTLPDAHRGAPVCR